MSADKDHLYIEKKLLKEQIETFYEIAQAGLEHGTTGLLKEAQSLQKSMHDFREASSLGLYHKEDIAVLSVDTRKSSEMARIHSGEEVWIVFQCFLPMLAYIVKRLNGEVISFRGDGLIAGFGFNEENWYPCTNRSWVFFAGPPKLNSNL